MVPGCGWHTVLCVSLMLWGGAEVYTFQLLIDSCRSPFGISNMGSLCVQELTGERATPLLIHGHSLWPTHTLKDPELGGLDV